MKTWLHGRNRAVALVIVLGLVALVSAILVAFVTRARLDMSATRSYVATPQAEALAMGALDMILFELRREIESGSEIKVEKQGEKPEERRVTYIPKRDAGAEANLLVQPVIARGKGDGAKGFLSLVKVSGDGIPMFDSDRKWNFGGEKGFDGASAISTEDPSANGRSLKGRWNAPWLLWVNENLKVDEVEDLENFSTDSLPNWVFIGRTGAIDFGKDAPVTASHRNREINNQDYVLGRFAFAVYDLSGLLDVNVVGKPGDVSEDEGPRSKPNLAWLDSEAFLGRSGLDPSDFDGGSLASWRARKNQKAGWFEWLGKAASNAFVVAVPDQNRFLGRGDLVEAARPESDGGVSRLVGLTTNSLPFLTLFSLEKNAPTWMPRTNTQVIEYEDESLEDATSSSCSTNRFVVDVRIPEGGGFTVGKAADRDTDPVVFREGDPLVKRRFPLSHLKLFAQYEESKDEDVATKIKRYFRLVPYKGLDKRLLRLGGGFRTVWVYLDDEFSTQRDTTKPANSITALDRVLGKGREPDFFELLQAGILYGSLGKWGWKGPESQLPRFEPSALALFRDRSSYHQLLQIGANIIDQYDRDSYPTIIISKIQQSAFYGYPRLNLGDLFSVFGVENIPYISHVGYSGFRDKSIPDSTAAGTDFHGDNQNWPMFHRYLMFELWNPHNEALRVASSSGALNGSAAGRYRIRIDQGRTRVWPPSGNRRNADDMATWGQVSAATGLNRRLTYEQLYLRWQNQVPPNQWSVQRNFDITQGGGSVPARPTDIRFTVDPANKYASFERPTPLVPRHGAFQIGRAMNLTVRTPLPSLPGELPDEFNYGLQVNIVGAWLGACKLRNNLDQEQLADPDDLNQRADARENDFQNVYARADTGEWYWSPGRGIAVEMESQIAVRLEKLKDGGNEETDSDWMTCQVFVPKTSVTSVGPETKNLVAGTGIDGGQNELAISWTGTYGTTFWNQGTRTRPINHDLFYWSDPRARRFGMVQNSCTINTDPHTRTVFNTIRNTAEASSLVAPWGWTNWFWGWGSRRDVEVPDYSMLQDGVGGNIKYDASMWAPWADGYDRMRHAFAEFAENRSTQQEGDAKMWAEDNDGVVRRGDGWRQQGEQYNIFGDNGRDQGTASLAKPRRLDRPFQSVAELGYVLRDDPWKTLNFFWGDSADAGLLDLFCVEESPGLEVRAGTVNLNKASDAVLASLFAGTRLNAVASGDSRESDDNLTIESSGTEINELVQGFRDYLGDSYNPDNVIRNVADLAPLTERILGDEAVGQINLFKWRQEAVARSLADVCNTRTWNLLVDVVAQSGGFGPDSKTAKNFLVKSERRYWMHLALDRFTGEVVGMEIERVSE